MNMATLSLTSESSIASGGITWPEASAIKQRFSLPDSIIYYITKHPSTSKIYLKLTQSCKYFFEKNPIIVGACIYGNQMKICSNIYIECFGKRKCCVKFDITKCSSKIWLTSEVQLSFKDISTFVPLLVSKIYRCERAQLKLNGGILSLKDFQLLASKFQKFEFYHVELSDDGENVVINESKMNVKEFVYHFDYHTPVTTTMKNICKLLDSVHIRKIWIENIPDSCNIDDFHELITNNKDTKIWLDFHNNLFAEFKNQLDQLINTVIAENTCDCIIKYDGQNWNKYVTMNSRASRDY